MLTFLKKVIDFVAHPTHSRTMGLVVMLILVAAVSLTVIVAQQQQQLRQRASGQSCEPNYIPCTETYTSCTQICDVDKDSGLYYTACTKTCVEDYDYCKQGVDKASSACLASSVIPTPTPTPTPTSTPIPTAYSITLNPATTSCSGNNSLVHLTWTTQGFTAKWFDVAIDGTYVTNNDKVGNLWDSGPLKYNQLYRFKVKDHDWHLTVGGTPVQSNEVSVTARDCLLSPALDPNATSVSINLDVSTNFISLPVTPTNNSITALISFIENKISTIFFYDTATGLFKSYSPGPAADNLSTLEPGKGYRFEMNEAATLTVIGVPYEFQPISLQANKYYAIGAPFASVKLSEILGTCKILNLRLNDKTDAGPAISLNSNTLLETKKGYWIQSTNNCTLSKIAASQPTLTPTPTPTPNYTVCTGRYYSDSDCKETVGGFDTGCIQNNPVSDTSCGSTGNPNTPPYRKAVCSSCSPSQPTPTPTPTPSAFDTCAKTRSYCKFDTTYKRYECSFGLVSCDEIKSFYTCSFGKEHVQTIENYQDCLTRTATPTPTPAPGSIQLALILTQQGLTGIPVNRNRPVTVVLKGADDQIITKTGTVNYSSKNEFRGTVNLGLLPSGSYELKIKVGKFLRSPISILDTKNLAISGTAFAYTTLVAGLAPDQNNNNIDAISFFYADGGLKSCFGSTLGIKKCDSPQDVDLNGDGNVDAIDYNIYLKGIRNLVLGLPVK